jgi:hypothetical protein
VGTTRCQEGRCAPILCHEPDGPVCALEQRCNPDALLADANGCEPLPCDDYVCAATERCDPEAVGANAHGCVVLHCAEPGGVECPAGQHCVTAAPVPRRAPIHCTAAGALSCPVKAAVTQRSTPTPVLWVSSAKWPRIATAACASAAAVMVTPDSANTMPCEVAATPSAFGYDVPGIRPRGPVRTTTCDQCDQITPPGGALRLQAAP